MVDDNATNRRFLGVLLESWGCEHEEVADGQATLDCLHTAAEKGRPFELALLDMHMPRMDGQELARRIRQDPALTGLEMIVLTSLGNCGDTEELRRIRIAAWLTKPIKQTPAVRVHGSGSGKVTDTQRASCDCSGWYQPLSLWSRRIG